MCTNKVNGSEPGLGDGEVALDLWGMFRRRRRSGVPVDLESLDRSQLPRHVAVIMDGNGRWARARGMPRAAGHHAGMGTMRGIIRAADDLGIGALTLYAFSTENWKRPRQEIQYLWQLVGEFFRSDMNELVERNVRVWFLGDTTVLPAHTQAFVKEAKRLTEHNTGMIVQFALNYGSRSEIVDATRAIARRVQSGELRPEDIDEKQFSDALATCGVPDPDLLIRTAGDVRISNFLLWQIAYAELYFTPLAWPDFNRDEFLRALVTYTQRERRFGAIKT